MDRTNLLVCCDCKVSFERRSRTGPIPKRCDSCKKKHGREADRAWRLANPDAAREKTRRWQSRNRDLIAQYNHRAKIKRAYGIEYDEYLRLLAAQRNRCAVCGGGEHRGRNWHVDHDHITGQVRGLLCAPCNTGIGHLRDDPDVMLRAAEYVRRHRQQVLNI